MVGIPVGEFLRTLGRLAAEETWAAATSFVRRMRDARRSSPIPDGWVEFDDPDGTKLMIADVDDEAFKQLEHIDWEAHKGAQLMWDDEAKEWYDPSRRYG